MCALPLQRRPCPEEDAHFLSRITWWWQTSQIWSGWRHSLSYDDLTDLNAEDKSRVIAPHFQRHWDKELEKAGLVFVRMNQHLFIDDALWCMGVVLLSKLAHLKLGWLCLKSTCLWLSVHKWEYTATYTKYCSYILCSQVARQTCSFNKGFQRGKRACTTRTWQNNKKKWIVVCLLVLLSARMLCIHCLHSYMWPALGKGTVGKFSSMLSF